jgi:glycosyltransferase involved in cell wall biosynthesis
LSPEISICVCTYRRPAGLRDLLRSLTELVPEPPPFEIIVVDNDGGRSGESALSSYRSGEIPLTYVVEPVKNISRARNRAVAEARAELIAFIDDDETAEPGWLAKLHKTLVEHAADAVFGPVLHRFAKPPPQWLTEQKFFDYPVPNTGSEMPCHMLRTGNVLFRKCFLRNLTHLFDESLGLTGGGDTDFFTRMSTAGGKLIAAQEAIVYETVPIERMGIGWISRRHYRMGIGKISASIREREPAWRRLGYFLAAIFNLCKRLVASMIWYPFARGRSAKNFLKSAYWFGICAGFLGFRYYEYK